MYGGLTIGISVLWLFFVRSPRVDERPTNPAMSVPFATPVSVPLHESLSAVFRAPSTKWVVALSVVAFWAILGLLSVLPEFADAQSYAVPEVLLGTPLYAATVGAITLPVLSDRIGRRIVLNAGVIGLVLGIVAAGFAPSLSLFVLGMAVAGVFGGGLNAMVYLLPGALTDINPAHVGTTAGVILSLGQVGGVASSVLGARVLNEVGVHQSSLVIAIPPLVGLACVTKLRLSEGIEQASVADVASETGD